MSLKMSFVLSALFLMQAPAWARASKTSFGNQDMQRLSKEATRQLTHCEKLKGTLKVADEDFKNLTDQKIDKEEFLKTLNSELAQLGPSEKAADALAKLPTPEATKLFAELATASSMKGRRPSSVIILNIYAKDGDRQTCKVTSELTKNGR